MSTPNNNQDALNPAETEEREQFEDVVRAFEQECLLIADEPNFDTLIELIDRLEGSLAKGGLQEHKVKQALIENRYTRIANCLQQYIVHPKARVTHDQLYRLCRRKQTCVYVFNASGFHDMRFLISIVGEEIDGQYKINIQRAAVLLCFMGIDDINSDLMDVVLIQPPRVLLTLMLGWLNQRSVLTQQGEINRTRLLAAGHLIEDVDIVDRDIPLIVNAWMYSSYASSARKHDIKHSFNKLLHRRLMVAGVAAEPKKTRNLTRPKLLICHERFTSGHAMYRCYAPYIESLRAKFHLVAMVDEICTDDAACQIFDEVIKLETPRPTVKQIVEMINDIEPDAIYYPSLGMSHWTVMLSTLRLAPVQFITNGHPATTHSENIDYVLTKHMNNDPSEIFSEFVLMGRSIGVFTPHADLPEPLPELLPPNDRVVRIAINSKVMKLSHRLIDICKRLESAASLSLDFRFFPGERNLYFDGLCAAIKAELPSAKIYPYMGYGPFVREIAECDMALAAFPFGNTNSTVDTCLLGLPTVVHYGPEVPAQTDELVLQTAGYQDWVVCKSDDEYFRAALRFINEPELRKSVANGQTRQQVAQRLFDLQNFASEEPFAELMWHAYTHHEDLQASPARWLSYRDIGLG